MAGKRNLADKIDALGTLLVTRLGEIDQRFDVVDRRFDAVDQRFDAVDRRFDAVDQRFDEFQGQLRVELEALDSKVQLVLEKVVHLIERDAVNTTEHAGFERQLTDHDVRIASIEARRRSQ